MVKTDLLKEALQASGLKRTFIAEQMGLTVQTLNNKCSGKTEFTISEVNMMCHLLNLPKRQRDIIFFEM